MSEQKNELTWGHLGIVVLVVATFGLAFGALVDIMRVKEERGYKQGQIDALNGKWKYEVVVKPDTTYITKPK